MPSLRSWSHHASIRWLETDFLHMTLFSPANASIAFLRKNRWNAATWTFPAPLSARKIRGTPPTERMASKKYHARRDVWVVVGNANFQPNNMLAVSVDTAVNAKPRRFQFIISLIPYAIYSLTLWYSTTFVWDDTLIDFQRQQDQQFLECCELILY